MLCVFPCLQQTAPNGVERLGYRVWELTICVQLNRYLYIATMIKHVIFPTEVGNQIPLSHIPFKLLNFQLPSRAILEFGCTKTALVGCTMPLNVAAGPELVQLRAMLS